MKGDRVSGKDQGSVFTRHLVSGLRTGEADLNGDGNITVDELYTFARDHVIEEMPNQHPKRQEDVEGAIILAQNVKWDFPSYVRHSLTSPLAADRLSALDTLTRLYQIGNETVRTRVIAKTRKMVDDNSRLVSSAAADLLAAAGRTGEDNRIEVTARRAAEDERQRAADERAGSQPHLTTAAAALVETCVRKKLPDPKRAEKAAASWWSVSTSVGRVTANPEWNVLLPALPVRQFRGEGWVGRPAGLASSSAATPASTLWPISIAGDSKRSGLSGLPQPYGAQPSQRSIHPNSHKRRCIPSHRRSIRQKRQKRQNRRISRPRRTSRHRDIPAECRSPGFAALPRR